MALVVIKTGLKQLPEYCEECDWYDCIPHPHKGWSEVCELEFHCMDDDQPDGWIYDGNGRPKNCPLMEVKEVDGWQNTMSDADSPGSMPGL